MGGITIGCSGEDAYAKIRAGATLVQIWTSLAYEGPGVVPRIKVGPSLVQFCVLSPEALDKHKGQEEHYSSS